MPDCALIAPAAAFHSSTGACLDAFMLVDTQVERLFRSHAAMRMETRLRLLSQDARPVTMADGRSLAVEGGLETSLSFDLVHIASFRVGSPAALAERIAASGAFLAWLRNQHERGAIISASGSAVFLLAEAGLLGALPAPMPRALIGLWRTRYPRLPIDDRRPVVDHGSIVMGSGLAADQALMVRLIERIISPEMARWLASVIGVDRVEHDRLPDDPLVANAQLWIEQHFTEDFRIGDLARTLSTSHQTLIRRFTRAIGMRPREYAQHLRIQAAQRMLRQTHRRIELIATLVGYADARSFREIFRERTGMSASAYRASARTA